MRIGMVGLGRMGGNMARRLMRDGHECVVTDLDADAVATLADEGASGADDLAALVGQLESPRAVWVMVPAGVVAPIMDELSALLEEGDVVVDGGNSRFVHAIERAEVLAERGIHHVDAGVSGGVWGLEEGYSLMVGASDEAFDRLEPALRSLAPGVDAAPRTAGRDGDPTPAEQGYLHCGPPGAGHFVKMVHNGIEYGVMAAYAEGLAILERADAGDEVRAKDAETAPMANPEHYRFELDLASISEVWRRGSVIRSWLLDLTAVALHADPTLADYRGHVSDSGEGRWTVQAAVDIGVPAHVISAALFQRFASRGNSVVADRALSAMREQFGGHDEQGPDTHPEDGAARE